MSTSSTNQCPLCDGEASLVAARQEITVGRRRVVVLDEHMYCASCDEAFYTPDQSETLAARARAAVEQRENLLTPEEILRVRTTLGFTQTEFEELLGVGAKTCARWESGRVRPNVTTDRLIRLLLADRENVRRLAAVNGVPLRDSAFVPVPWHESDRPEAPIFGRLGIGGSLSGTTEDPLTATSEHEAVAVAALGGGVVILKGSGGELYTPRDVTVLKSKWRAQ